MTSPTLTIDSAAHWLRRALAACLTALLTVVALIAVAPAAHANTPGINIAVLHNGTVVEEGADIPEGDPLLLRLQYDAAAGIGGTEITITLTSNITVPGTLPGNEAIEEIVNNVDGTITVRFKDPIPDDVAEGVLGINLQASQVDRDEETHISWKIGEDTGGVTLVINDKIEPPVEVNEGYSKGVNPKNLDSFVTVGEDDERNYFFAGLDPSIEEEFLTYTLVLDSSQARNGYSVKDVLPAGLGYVAGSFGAQLTTYNPETTADYTFSPTVSGNSFTGTVSVPENSSLRITYQVKVTGRVALEGLLESQFDGLNGSSGNFQILLTNTASFGEDKENDRTADLRIRGNIPGVGVGNQFSKNGSWSQLEVIAGEGGELDPPAEIVYTFGANLKAWDDRNPNFTLGQNVVISDTLPNQAEWKTGDSEFITASGVTLTEADRCPSGAADFIADDFVGQWCVDGQTLLINVGKDRGTNANIQAKARLNTVAELTEKGNTTILGATSYLWPNTAQFHYRDGNPYEDKHDAYPVVLPDDRDGGINDSAVFVKAGPESEVQATPGETAEVPYRFTINTSKESVDPLKSKIVDEINSEIFDISNPQEIPVSGSYGGEALAAEHFVVSVDAEGNLVIELSEAGKTIVGEADKGQQWIIDIVLTTVTFDGKETLEIYNKATLYGSDDDPDYWSDNNAEATSYGDEAELRKRIYDTETGGWVTEMNAQIENGQFIENRFVYSIELIPRGNYGTAFPVQIFTRDDVLPDAVEFLGFVDLDEDGAPMLNNLSDGPNAMNGNVIATYEDGVVTIQQEDGTNLNPNDGRIVTYFAVQATDSSKPIVNRVIGSEATINPYGDPSIDIEKWNDEGSAPEYDESGALMNDGFDGDFDKTPGKKLTAGKEKQLRFTVSNDGREDLVNVVVSDRLTAGTGEIHDLSCVFPDDSTGTKWEGPFLIGTQFDCTGTLPALDSGATHSDSAQVVGTGIFTGIEVEDADDWHGFVPEAAVTPTPGGLAVTGSAGAPIAIIAALLLLLAGGGALLVNRRNRVGA